MNQLTFIREDLGYLLDADQSARRGDPTMPLMLSNQAFAALGKGRLAYIKGTRSELIGFLCPAAPMLVPGRHVFVLHAADGSPILVTDTPEAARANAAHDNLETVLLH